MSFKVSLCLNYNMTRVSLLMHEFQFSCFSVLIPRELSFFLFKLLGILFIIFVLFVY